MKLKKLEIQGFKSFADRTVVDFQQGVTGIVGPNGCGKSNIVDAIRWVMGEMSAKHLRGREMQDVIFSGSEARASAAMAEVNLILSNEDGRGPNTYSQFSEISITRRLYRSGESEYLINKAVCRLRDIYDVFLGTGVGTKAYSIVEQGQIGQVILSKPEERRRIIEEAAGISKFKARKEAALRKMEATQGNLTRLEDVLGELSRQINSLDRQAKKAEKYRELREEARRIELLLSSHDYLRLNQNFNEGEKKISELGEQETSCAVSLSQLDTELETIKLVLTEEEQELSDVQEKLYEKNNAISLHQQAVQFKSKEIQRLLEQETNSLNEIEEIKERLHVIDVDLDSMNQEQVKIDLLVAQSEEDLFAHQQKVNQEEEKQRDAEREAEVLQQELMQLLQSISESNLKQELLSRQKVDLKGRIGKNQGEIEEIDKQLSHLVSRRREFEGSLNDFNQFKLDISLQSDQVHHALLREKEEHEKMKSEWSRLKEDLSFKKSRLHSLEEIQKSFEGYHEGVRKVMLRKSSQAEFHDVYGTVADVIETEPRYQSAVGAALGEKLQYVVVKSQEAGLQAVEYLKTESAGRSSFVPVGLRDYDSGSEEAFPAAGSSGVMGPLKDFVQLREEYRPVGDYLFRDVWLVESLGRALQIWNSNGHKKTLVTLDGEVVDPYGVVSGGSLEDKSATLLEKKREIRELIDQVKTLEGKLRWQDEEVKKCEARLQTLNASLENLKKDSHGEELKILNYEKDLSHLKAESDRLLSRRDALSIEIAAWMGEEQEMERESNDWLLKSGAWQIEKQEKEERLSQLKQDLSSNQIQLDIIKEELTKRKMSFETIHEKKSLIEREVKRLLDLKSASAIRHEECLRLITIGNQESGQLRKDIAASEEALRNLIVEVDALQSRSVALKETFEIHQSQVREKELSVREFRKKHDELKTELNTWVVKMTEVRGRLQVLREQIFERYHTEISMIATEYQDQIVENRPEQETRLAELKDKLSKLGEVNVGAIHEYEELKKRHDFLNAQSEDLKTSLESLNRVIQKINRATRKRFQETFVAVDQKFQELFPKLFQGGRAKLVLTDEENILETGLEIIAQPPGKKLQSISLLSGGERALTAVCLIFSIFLIKPSPFCILDEVDAPLDDANIDRFNDLVRSMVDRSQFILITHSKRTMELADVLYGITMQEPGVSKTVSVKLN